MNQVIDAILKRRAIKVFDSIEIPANVRDLILDAARFAPSSFNSQPYRFYWIESPLMKKKASDLCFGQMPATTAPALIVAVADIGCWKSTGEAQLAWMREAGISAEKISEFEKRAKLGKWFYGQGWFGLLGALKWAICHFLNLWKVFGMPPVSQQGLFKWATKNTSLACENTMIAAEALGLNTCPMEGFDGRRLSKLLGLSPKYQEIVMVIAIGKKSPRHVDQFRWRRPLDATVTIL
jgi:nitroreductase